VVNNAGMEDVIAVEVGLADGQSRYFLTWGRIQQKVDPGPVAALVLAFARHVSLGGEPVSARVCHSLREAAESSDAPYFYECLLGFSRKPIPFGDGYQAWRAAMDEAMRSGDEIAYCGRPSAPPLPRTPD
jgi:hypothetical protein